jgi:hypothetical protein
MNGLTSMQLAVRIARGARFTNQLLADLEAKGMVECIEGEWRLTAETEFELGQALRSFEPLRERWVPKNAFLPEAEPDDDQEAA